MAKRTLKDLRILITGASEGIGRALALQCAAKGARVMATARKLEKLQTLAQESSQSVYPVTIVQADVSTSEGRATMVDAVKTQFGGLDILVNNAGIGATGHFADSQPETFRQIIETNVFGTIETTRLFVPILEKGKTPAVVNVSSILGRRAIPGRSLYCTSKFAIEGWTQAIRAEFVRFGIDVILINPGLTQTSFSQNMLERNAKMQLDHMRGMTSDQVATAIIRAMEKGKKVVSLTLQGKALLFAARFLPFLVDRVSKKKVKELYADEIAARQSKPTA